MTEDERDFEIIQFSSAPTDGLAALCRIIDRRIREASEGRNRGEAHQDGAVIVRVSSERSERPAASTSVTYCRAPLPEDVEALAKRLDDNRGAGWTGGCQGCYQSVMDEAATLLRRWPRYDHPLSEEIEATIARIQARPGADWDRETVALLRRWPKQYAPPLPEEVQAVFDDIDVIFAEAFLEDTQVDFGRSAEQALCGFEKIVALLRRLGATVLPEEVEAMASLLERGGTVQDHYLSTMRDAAALLRRWPRQSP